MSERHLYRPTEPLQRRADPADPIPRPPSLLVLAIIATAVASIGASIVPVALRSFRAVLEGFGATLPRLTRFMLGSTLLWVMLAFVAVGLLIWVGTRREVTRAQRDRMTIAIVGFLVLYGVLIAAGVFALYLPLFALGEVV